MTLTKALICSSFPPPLPGPGPVSLGGSLAQGLPAVLARAKGHVAQAGPPKDQESEQCRSLRLGRDRQAIIYLYRPTLEPGAIPAALTQAVVAAWADSPIPVPLDPGFWGVYLRAHTPGVALGSGQMLLRPTATALGAWLWVFGQGSPPPLPSACGREGVPFPYRQAPLAEALHLSPLALLQYTHMRCHALASPPNPPITLALSPTDPDLAPRLSALAPSDVLGQRLLRGLVALVDDLADSAEAQPLPTPVLSRGFGRGYHLCEGVDGWLRGLGASPHPPATGIFLRGIALGLAHLLQGWLHAPAPTDL